MYVDVGTAPDEGQSLRLTREQISLRLREVALFHDLRRDDLNEILRISEAVRVDRGEYVFEEGDRGDHFYVIVHGSVEVRKTTADGYKRLAALRAGQAFGEMALLNQTPRSASVVAAEDTYLLSVSRAAFSRMLGGDTLSVRLLKNLSRALWATSLRLADQQSKRLTGHDTGHETLAELNRLVRARLLPRVTPRVSGYETAAFTLTPRLSSGATAWDWFVLADGRPAFVVFKAIRNDLFSAQRLGAVRMLLRGAAADPHPSLGALLSKVNRDLRAGWIEGVSGSVLVGLAALADGAVEWVSAGPVTGVVVGEDGRSRDLSTAAPSLGEHADRSYESRTIVLARGDRVIALTDTISHASSVSSALLGAEATDARTTLTRVLGGLDAVGTSEDDVSDVSAVVLKRVGRRRIQRL